ncbi:MAG: DUF5666 domain-containing protein [Dehalococcoidales bacterium]|nr:DUF5666 domain-containing protein [Dehalococcoidales bacterium]
MKRMLKTLVIAVLALSLTVGIALPALANNGKTAASQTAISLKADTDKEVKAKVQIIRGTVTKIDGNVITINGKEVVVSDGTKYKIPGLKEVRLADIKVGMSLVAQTRLNNGKLEASHVIEVPGRIVSAQHTGNVTAFTYDPTNGGSITIVTKAGQTVTFEIVGGKFKVLPKGAEVKVGETVTVASRRDTQNRLIATGVVVHPAPLQKISGNITALNEIGSDNGTLTIGTTTLKYDASTVFTLRGAGLSIKVGQPATATYRAQTDGSLLAKQVQIGTWPKPVAKKAS